MYIEVCSYYVVAKEDILISSELQGKCELIIVKFNLLSLIKNVLRGKKQSCGTSLQGH